MHDIDGTRVVGAVVMCLRKLLNWNDEQIVGEFRRFTRDGEITGEEIDFLQHFNWNPDPPILWLTECVPFSVLDDRTAGTAPLDRTHCCERNFPSHWSPKKRQRNQGMHRSPKSLSLSPLTPDRYSRAPRCRLPRPPSGTFLRTLTLLILKACPAV